MIIRRGDIYYADLSPVIGSEQGGLRPVLVIQNDIGNYYSETTIVAAITSRKGKNTMPTHVPIFQNDVGNKHSPTVICAAITSRMNKAKLPTHVELPTRRCAMIKDSVILLEQLRTIDKQRLKEKICHIDEELQQKVDEALMISLELRT